MAQVRPRTILKIARNLKRDSGIPAAIWLLWLSAIVPPRMLAIGPDAFGYTAQPSSQFSFLQITNAGASRVLWFDDDTSFTANLGFTFNFYGSNYTSVSFSPNGLMTLGGSSSDYSNIDFNLSSPSNNFPTIALLWDDWETQENWSDAVYFKTIGTNGSRQFIVQWNKVIPVNGDGTNTVTFQVRLFEGSNRILFSYLDTVVSDESIPVASLGLGATVGIRDRNGEVTGRKLQWSYNQPIITNGLNLLFSLPDRAPLAANSILTTLEDAPVTIAVLDNVTDPDADPLALTWVSAAGHGSVTTNLNGTITYSPAADFFGTDRFTYAVSDGQGASTTATVTITVLPVNDRPTLDPLPDLLLNEDSRMQSVNLTGISPGANNEADTLTVTASSSNPSLIPAPVVNYASPGSSGTLNFTPQPNTFGTASITVTVDDGRPSNNVVVRVFTVTVKPVNDPPTLDPLIDLAIDEDSPPQTIFLTGIGPGVSNEADDLTVSAISSNPALIPDPLVTYFNSESSGMLTLRPAPNAFGQAVITVEVSDGQPSNNLVVRSFKVTVAPLNDPPTLNPIANLLLDELPPPQRIALSGIGSGSANELQKLIVTASTDQPNLITNLTVAYRNPDSTGTLAFAIVPGAVGTATIEVTVNDSGRVNNLITRSFLVRVGLHIETLTILNTGSVRIDFHGRPANQYRVEASTDLVHWTGIGLASEYQPGLFRFEDSAAAAWRGRLYRLVNTPSSGRPSRLDAGL